MRSKKRGVRSLVLFAWVLLSPVVTDTADVSGNINDIAVAIATYFPKLTGTVVKIEADTLYIDIKNGFGLSEGVLLSVFREGASFKHPVTAIPLGNFEKEIGWVEVTQFNPQQVVARMIAKMPVTKGDGVRLTKGRIPIGIMSDQKTGLAPFILREFSLALADTGRFSVAILPENATHEAAAAQGNLYLIALTVGEVPDPPRQAGAAILDPSPRETPTVHTRLQNTKTGKGIAEFDVTLKTSDESDFIVESFQQRLFEKYQKGGLHVQ